MRLESICGILGVLIGLDFVFPQIVSWRQQTDVKLGLLILGCAVVVAGICFLFYGFKARRA